MGWIIAIGVWMLVVIGICRFFKSVKRDNEEFESCWFSSCLGKDILPEEKQCQEKTPNNPLHGYTPTVTIIDDPTYRDRKPSPKAQKKLGKMYRQIQSQLDQRCAALGLKSTPAASATSGRSTSGTRASRRSSKTERCLKFSEMKLITVKRKGENNP